MRCGYNYQVKLFFWYFYHPAYVFLILSDYIASNGSFEEQQPGKNLKGSHRHMIDVLPSHFPISFETGHENRFKLVGVRSQNQTGNHPYKS